MCHKGVGVNSYQTIFQIQLHYAVGVLPLQLHNAYPAGEALYVSTQMQMIAVILFVLTYHISYYLHMNDISNTNNTHMRTYHTI